MKVALLPAEHIFNWWPKLRGFVSRAVEYSHGRYEPEDLLEGALDGKFSVWVAYVPDGGEIKGVVVTAVIEYPRKRCLDMTFMGGDDGFDWKEPMLEALQGWAKTNGCSALEASGRTALAKVFKDDGYRLLWQVFEMPVNSEDAHG